MNYQTAIQSTSKAIKECYSLATKAYNLAQLDTQAKLYKIADGLQIQLNTLMAMETKHIQSLEKIDTTLLK